MRVPKHLGVLQEEGSLSVVGISESLMEVSVTQNQAAGGTRNSPLIGPEMGRRRAGVNAEDGWWVRMGTRALSSQGGWAWLVDLELLLWPISRGIKCLRENSLRGGRGRRGSNFWKGVQGAEGRGRGSVVSWGDLPLGQRLCS